MIADAGSTEDGVSVRSSVSVRSMVVVYGGTMLMLVIVETRPGAVVE